MATVNFKCVLPECTCTNSTFHIIPDPDRGYVPGDCTIVRNASRDHVSDRRPQTPAKANNAPAPSHAHPPNAIHSTPLKVSALSGTSVNSRSDAGRTKRITLAATESDDWGWQLVRGNSSPTGVRFSLATELNGAVFVDATGLEDIFFTHPAPNIAKAANKPGLPVPRGDTAFVPWLVARLVALGAGRADAAWEDTRFRRLPCGFSTTRCPDFHLVRAERPPPRAASSAQQQWQSILAMGEHQSAGCSDTQAFLQLANYASQIFAHQPIAARVHALRMRRRSSGPPGRTGGPAALLPVDARTLARLARLALHPASNAVQLGLQLGETLCRRRGIVGRGTYCALATRRSDDVDTTTAATPDGRILAKFSWRAHERRSEGDMLHVGNVASLHVAMPTAGIPLALGPVIRSLLADGYSTMSNARPDTATPAATAAKADNAATAPATTPDDTAMPTEIRFENRIWTCVLMATVGKPLAHCTSRAHAANALLAGLVAHASSYFTGRVLHRDVSPSNILFSRAPLAAPPPPPSAAAPMAFVLPPRLTALHGFLIDLDYAVEFPAAAAATGGEACSGAPYRTSTLPFMSIGILMAERHVYAHDLHSFLYVLIWVCCGGKAAHMLHTWSAGPMEYIANCKRGQMVNTRSFESLLRCFAFGGVEGGPGGEGGVAGMQRVARAWRDVLNWLDAGSVAGLYVVEQPSVGTVNWGLGKWEAFIRMRDILWQVMQDEGWVM
ncbi:hypothetical protein DFH27DRAFT_617629 [Peziza echinospora]|nr:hypothetical protein DFH27DRAFT_617629 [Peziza echinospora]